MYETRTLKNLHKLEQMIVDIFSAEVCETKDFLATIWEKQKVSEINTQIFA